jgi:hypothetical protein
LIQIDAKRSPTGFSSSLNRCFDLHKSQLKRFSLNQHENPEEGDAKENFVSTNRSVNENSFEVKRYFFCAVKNL